MPGRDLDCGEKGLLGSLVFLYNGALETGGTRECLIIWLNFRISGAIR
jgi:hypothetical protein